MTVRDRRDSRPDSSVEAQSRALGLNIGWTVFSYMLSGMAAYGGIGWLIGRAVHVSMLFPIGMLVGLAISVGWIIWRYGRSGAQATPGAQATSGTAATPRTSGTTRTTGMP
ncbi:hypothetical protein [Trebonia sp.]|uniref:hypothetical protein n=1 Tax=Trebonia sp. TaxID=2767075 RepID=UPI0026299948|nr:hypothetical protein [Trebonia sp.]